VTDAIDIWTRLLDAEAEPLLAAIGASDPSDPAHLAALRARWERPLVEAAIELSRARVRAARKFPLRDDLAVDVAGVEQATSAIVADHKARRFAGGNRPVVDLCCGIGGDTMSLARVASVTAVDHDPLHAWMAGRNARCASRVVDVTTVTWRDVIFHLDPSRRDETPGGSGARRWRYEDYEPGPEFISSLIATAGDGAIKLGPGVDLAALPAVDECEIEIINAGGTLVQTVLWCGCLARAPGARTATRLPDGVSFTGRPSDPATPPTEASADGRLDRHLLVPDPAIERAGLVDALCAGRPIRAIHPGLGLLTSDEPLADPWLREFEILAEMPWRVKKVKAWLVAHDGGMVEVRTRGHAIDADAAHRSLKSRGTTPHTVFGLRLGRRVIALITRPRPRNGDRQAGVTPSGPRPPS